MNYFYEIKNIIEIKEINEKVRRLQSNKDTLNAYYKIGKLLLDAQGGEKRAKYGDRLIKECSVRFVEKYGKGYDSSNLRRMRQYYRIGQKCGPLAHKLTWTHWNILLPIKNENERKYYINQCILNNLSKRNDKFILEYVNDEGVYLISYEVNELIGIK